MTSPPAGPGRLGSAAAWALALRPHQWAKNALLFVPAMAAHGPWTRDVVVSLAGAFAAFSLLASATYLLNDVGDAPHDRAHPAKRSRAVAAGHLAPRWAVTTAVVLLGASFALAWQFRPAFQAALGAYLLLTACYSVALKRVAVLDVIVLATLYATRVVAGAAVVAVPLSRWFLAFSVFLFLSLALLKRITELHQVADEEHDRVAGRGYVAGDLNVLVALGVAAAMASTLVYCLYITGREVTNLYARPDFLWGGFLLLLYWEARIWLLAARRRLEDDPVVFALRDPTSYAVAAAFLLAVWLAA